MYLQLSNNIKLIAVFFVIVLLSVVYYGFKSSESQNDTLSARSEAQEPHSNVNNEKDSSSNSRNLQHTNTSIWKPMGDATSKAEIVDWFAKRGVYGFEGYKNSTEYDSYDVETLRKLGDNGDLRALHKLTDDLQVADFQALLEKAAIYGSTGAFRHMAIVSETKAALHSKSVEEKKLGIMEALAYTEAAQLRGDWWVKIGYGDSLPKMHSVTLTEQDKLQIQKRGKEIYDDLQAKRTAMGLGDFDNSIPDSVMKYYEEMLRPLH